MTDTQAGYIQALADLKAWHRIKLNERMGAPVRVREVHEQAIAWLEQLIAIKRQHAEEDEADARAKGAT